MSRTIALGGFMGVGKTTMGRLLARDLGCPFIDLDESIERRSGKRVRQIFDEDGEVAFRALEKQALDAVLDGSLKVVALGGGTLHQPDCLDQLQSRAQVVVLWLPLKELLERLGDQDDARPLWAESHRLFVERERGYLSAGHVLNLEGCNPEQALIRLKGVINGHEGCTVMEGGTLDYPIVLSHSFDNLRYWFKTEFPKSKKVVVIADTDVAQHYGDEVRRTMAKASVEVAWLDVPGGESSKTVRVWEALVDSVLDVGVDRTTPIMALGGGSIGDLVGFVAASVMRGVPLIQVPTTLLSMVDSSVGGKTGLNTKHGKNLVGAFYPPSLVFAPLSSLTTLDNSELLSGLGEVVKHGVLGDADLFALCRNRATNIRQPDVMSELVSRSVALKASIVAQDQKESGLRAVLNLGHTVGHAIEKVAMDCGVPIPHGICVAMGVHAEVHWAEVMGACPAGTAKSVSDVMTGLGLPLRPKRVDFEALIRAVKFDKKVRRGKLATAVVEDIGRVRLVEIDESDIPSMFHSLEDG